MQHLLQRFKNSFTIGEASVIAQMLCVMICESGRMLIYHRNSLIIRLTETKMVIYSSFTLVLGSLLIIIILWVLGIVDRCRSNPSSLVNAILFYLGLVLIIGGILYPLLNWLIQDNPFLWVFSFIGKTTHRQILVLMWLVMIIVSVLLYQPENRKDGLLGAIPKILRRKYFHLLAIAMFTPALMLDEMGFLVLSYCVSISAFILLELIKYSKVPPFSGAIDYYMRMFVDSRDSGVITLTHIYLLLGCAIPTFLCYMIDYMSSQVTHYDYSYHILSPYAGLLTVGVGDTMASYWGIKSGRTKVFGSPKSLEGTLGGAISTVVASAIVIVIIESPYTLILYLPKIIIASFATSFIEASTLQIDNLILPFLFLVILNF
ncbi:hypothetical protein DLAC_02964 [Tieghemostelium lacteum]|uniref:dolichol kinase n=1 Tax=Tieghemostelium lacteum TaxID=361077 RepID=A0A152A3R1_TIELA|nr:hypothetical protein DLAC_02964 [Tieghemostelium lacteum]|eukprot:KYR00902.1 hypothetical protein DLAC_02964 [Tieghemostelium lacteum]